MSRTFNIGAAEIEEGKTLAGISYFGLIGFLIAIVAGRDNRFTMYHAQQSVALTLLFMVRYIPFTPRFLDGLIALAVFILFILGLVNGFSGKVKPLPLIGEAAYALGFCKPEAE